VGGGGGRVDTEGEGGGGGGPFETHSPSSLLLFLPRASLLPNPSSLANLVVSCFWFASTTFISSVYTLRFFSLAVIDTSIPQVPSLYTSSAAFRVCLHVPRHPKRIAFLTFASDSSGVARHLKADDQPALACRVILWVEPTTLLTAGPIRPIVTSSNYCWRHRRTEQELELRGASQNETPCSLSSSHPGLCVARSGKGMPS
jgi:hypothetical protein